MKTSVHDAATTPGFRDFALGPALECDKSNVQRTELP